LALSRFKRERAFDRRIEWYARILEATHRLLWTMNKQIHAIEIGEPESVMEIQKEVVEILDEFALARATADVFGREGAQEALSKATAAVNDIGRLTQAAKAFGFNDPQGVLIRQKIMVLREAQQTIVAEAKSELYGKSIKKMQALLPSSGSRNPQH
jgi:hypothetical protein